MIKYIGKGRMRIAYKIGKYAIKFPYNYKGIKACIEELIIYLKNKTAPIAPVRFSIPGLCVVMPYYPDEFSEDKPKWFIESLNKLGIIDLHKYNIRSHKGKPVAIDYAINRCTGSGKPGCPTDGW